MPQTPASSSPHLSIFLEHPVTGLAHKPGDTITGLITRTAQGVAPEARVTVSLHGRTKTKLQIRRGQNTHTYRSSFNALSAMSPEDQRDQAQVLAAGAPIHIPAGGQGESWRFSLRIPEVVGDVRDKWQRKYFYSPAAAGGGAGEEVFPPPGTFYWEGDNWFTGKRGHGFTEYYVEAKIQLLKEGKPSVHVAVAPFPLRNVYAGLPVRDFGIRPCVKRTVIQAYRLSPGYGDAKLSFGQKTRQMFGSSKVPRLTLNVTMGLPSFLQVDNPNIVPVTMRIDPIPETNLTSEELFDIPQDVVIKSFSLRIKPRTALQAERHGFDRSSAEVNLLPTGAYAFFRQDLSISVTPTAASESKSAGGHTINFGEGLGIRIPERGLHHDLLTYNIVRSHELIWEVQGVVAGEDFKMGSSQPVRILPGPEISSEPVPGPAPGPAAAQDDEIKEGELPGYKEATGDQVPEVPPEKQAPPDYKA
ncbi:uncharacterized protein BDV14DRAFT_28449 [Aspergillus stella-maris]|uniref:uncharacterized protein n=1 Tax=Aspergillus stella-maris TaxID=1810926 RepID=UPI003CCDF711